MSLQQAADLLRQKKFKQANQMLTSMVRNEPDNANAWYLLSKTVGERDKKEHCLQEALRIDPDHEQAKARLANLKLSVINAKPKRKSWHMSWWAKVLTFIFVTPLWTLIVLDDPDSTGGVKVLAIILLLAYVFLACSWAGIV